MFFNVTEAKNAGIFPAPTTVSTKTMGQMQVIYFDSHLKSFKHKLCGDVLKLAKTPPVVKFCLVIEKMFRGSYIFQWRDGLRPSNWKEIEQNLISLNL